MHVIAVVDSMTPVVNRYRMNVIMKRKARAVLMYRKFMFKRFISKLIRVVVRVSKQDLHGWVLTHDRVDGAHQSYLHVGWNQYHTLTNHRNGNTKSCYRSENRAMPLQISADMEFYNDIVRFLCHSTAILYKLTSATVQMLKLHKVRWFSRPWRKITAIAENHGTRPVKATMIDIIDDTDNIDPSLLHNICPWLTFSQVTTTGSQVHNT